MQVRIDRINEVLREQITGMRVVRAFVREPHEARRFGGANDELTLTSLRAGRLMAFMFPTVMLVLNASSVAAIWIGGRPHRQRRDAGRRADRVPQLPHPDPDVGDDGHVRRGHGPARIGQRRPHRGGARRGVVGGATGEPGDSAAGTQLARAPRRRVPVPRGRAPGALRHLASRRPPARPPRSSAAPARARPPC